MIASNVLEHLPDPEEVSQAVEEVMNLVSKVPKKVDQTHIQNIRLAIKTFHRSVPQYLASVDDKDA